MSTSICACGSARAYAACCGPLHAGELAVDAEALMRSRYSAFTLGLSDYLLQSWHPSTRPATLIFEAEVKWLGLSIKAHQRTGADTATVSFVARWRQGGGSAQRQSEISRFVREQGHWFYLDAVG